MLKNSMVWIFTNWKIFLWFYDFFLHFSVKNKTWILFICKKELSFPFFVSFCNAILFPSKSLILFPIIIFGVGSKIKCADFVRYFDGNSKRQWRKSKNQVSTFFLWNVANFFLHFPLTFVSKSFCTNSKTVLGTLSVRIFRFKEQRFHFCCSFWANSKVPKTEQNVCEIRCESTKKKQIVRKRTKRTEHSLKPFLILWISASKFLYYKTAVTLRQRILLFLCFLFVLVSLSPFGSRTTFSKSHLTILLLGSEKQKENIKIFEYSNSWVSVDKCQRVESIKVVLQR